MSVFAQDRLGDVCWACAVYCVMEGGMWYCEHKCFKGLVWGYSEECVAWLCAARKAIVGWL